MVIYDENNNFFDLTRSDKEGVFLFKNKGTVKYPCTVCSNEVDGSENKKSVIWPGTTVFSLSFVFP